MLPPKHRVDYQNLLSAARMRMNIASYLSQEIPSKWRAVYIKSISHEPNLVRFCHRTFEYLCDVYSQLETTGSVP